MSKILTTYGARDTEVAGGVLPILKEGRIFSIETDGDKFVFTEQCDEWFYVALTPDQLRELAGELLVMADRASLNESKV